MASSTSCTSSSCMAKLTWLFVLIDRISKQLSRLAFVPPIAARLTIAFIFWSSGILKLPSGFLGIGKGNWDSTLVLFEYEHPVPLLSPEIAAYMGTTLEILCPILLIFGLGTRFAALALLVMTAVIEFTYKHSMDHVLWATALSYLIFQGAGCISLDAWIKRKSEQCPNYAELTK